MLTLPSRSSSGSHDLQIRSTWQRCESAHDLSCRLLSPSTGCELTVSSCTARSRMQTSRGKGFVGTLVASVKADGASRALSYRGGVEGGVEAARG